MKAIYWTTKNGSKINIDEMSIEHLRNTLKMIVTQNQNVPKTSPCNITQAFDMEMEMDGILKKMGLYNTNV